MGIPISAAKKQFEQAEKKEKTMVAPGKEKAFAKNEKPVVGLATQGLDIVYAF